MKKPTREEALAEADKLEAMIPNMRKYSGFGNNNHENARAEIRVLREDISEDKIYDIFNEETESGDNPEQQSALDARRWLDGETNTSPSEDFKPCMNR